MSTNKILWYIAGCTAVAAALVLWVRHAGESSEGQPVLADPAPLVAGMMQRLALDGTMDQAVTRAAVQVVADLAAQGALSSAEGFYALGLVLADSKALEPAEQAFRRAASLRPGWSWPHNALGILLGNYSPDRQADAEASFRKAIELEPTWSRPHNDLAILLRMAKRFEEAEAEALIALDLDPQNVATHNNYGNLLVAQSRLEEAEREFRTAISLDPNHPKPYYNLACTSALRGKGNEALSLLERAVELSPGLREDARVDPDFQELRQDPRFISLVGP